MDFLQNIFKQVDSVAKKTKTPAYVVGGFVRDFLMGREQNKDIDFVVVGSGLEFAKKFDEAIKQVGSLIEFPDFDTARYIIQVKSPKSKVQSQEEEIILEFAGARAEKYQAGSRKPVVEQTTLEEDLARRDFTVNSMAVPIAVLADGKKLTEAKLKKNLIDPFNGKKDLANKTLRTPLEPDKTFSDDPLRMMRAVRFASQLDFSIDPKTLQSIHKNRERLKIVSAERIQEELFKLMACPKPSIGLILMWQTHLLDFVLPEVAKLEGVEEIYGHQHKDNLTHTFKVVDNVAEFSDKTLLRLAGLFHDIGKPNTKKFIPKIGWTFYQHEHVGKKMLYQISRRLRFSKSDTDYLAKLVRWHMQPISLMDEGISDSAVRRLVVSLGEELNDLLILGRSDITTGNPYKKEKRLKNYDNLEKKIAEVLERDKLRAFQSPLRGDEIMELAKLKPGPTVGKIKEAIEEAILDGVIPNEYEAAKEYLGKIKDKYLADAQEWELGRA
ncbi:MAG: tRNA nucleotidyltransferase [Parcubacteria group bacterium Gr01-1014_44]|nr:MAG: tRNA nucleotidyltransferase [Parcubacteria group bacterium Gr01-1014_44]